MSQFTGSSLQSCRILIFQDSTEITVSAKNALCPKAPIRNIMVNNVLLRITLWTKHKGRYS